jgi:hypothetical protein
MFFAVFAVKVFHYSQREKKKILTAKVAKEAAKGSKVFNHSNQNTGDNGHT